MRYFIAFLILLIGAVSAEEPSKEQAGIGWQEAIARLAAERTRAETLKRYGNQATIGRNALGYEEALAEMDTVIAGLTVALSKGEGPTSLPDLEARLERGTQADRLTRATIQSQLEATKWPAFDTIQS